MLAAAIVDFRDADDVSSGADGAEGAAYQAAGLAHGPKNAPFETIGELDQVLGMTRALLNRLRPLATVYGRQAGIDPWRAPRELLVASSEGDGAGTPAPADIPSEFRMSSKGLAYRVIVRISTANGGRFARETVIERLRTAPLGFRVREWTIAPAETAPPGEAREDRGAVGDDAGDRSAAGQQTTDDKPGAQRPITPAAPATGDLDTMRPA